MKHHFTGSYLLVYFCLLTIWAFFSCGNGEEVQMEDLIDMDEETLSKGETLFVNHCSTCHNFNQDGIGPQLGGVTREVSLDWLRSFISNPSEMIDSGDERAQAVFARYNTYMPGFEHLGEGGIDAIIAYMHQYEAPKVDHQTRSDSIDNPIPEKIPLSDLVAELSLFAQVPASSDERPRARIAKMDHYPDENKLFIMDLRGKMFHISEGKTTEFMDMEKLMPNFINKPGLATGFGSFAFHPEYRENGLLYTSHTESPGSGKADFGYADSIKVTLQWVVTEWHTDDPLVIPFQGKPRELFRIDMVTGIHGMQELTFNPLSQPGDQDYGLLYIGIGDGGCVGSGFPFITYGPTQAWGSILRIDPTGKNSKNGAYGIPADNPFVGKDQLPESPSDVLSWQEGPPLEEIYAHGFRNAHRITWLRDGRMLASNIGQGKIESLYIVKPGDDYGWPIREGKWAIEPYMDINQVFPLPADEEEYGFTYPVAMYDHDEGNAIVGGYEYWGTEVPGLKGKYLFGDIVHGRLFFVNSHELERGKEAAIFEWQVSHEGEIKTLRELGGINRVDLRLARDFNGEIYLFTKADGKVYKVVGTSKL
ncbi:PQQ-dependent sugar dehydrogenase [Pleomorphovibrio marinus]|uniref:PQQ-dependent sugar dehydrogenase n=1 Tax=Pleomorphovibrio marinus TaxID=2164132 RepID=UPI000E0BA384|nr:PQQ-dependent sugar dehydrogenase [Pleomorphovibrio marinus]